MRASRRGIAAKLVRVILERGAYPRTWNAGMAEPGNAHAWRGQTGKAGLLSNSSKPAGEEKFPSNLSEVRRGSSGTSNLGEPPVPWGSEACARKGLGVQTQTYERGEVEHISFPA